MFHVPEGQFVLMAVAALAGLCCCFFVLTHHVDFNASVVLRWIKAVYMWKEKKESFTFTQV